MQSRGVHLRAAMFLAVATLLVSLGCAESPNRCTTGDLRCPCYPNNTCNNSLVCMSQVCVESQSSGGTGGTSTSTTPSDASADAPMSGGGASPGTGGVAGNPGAAGATGTDGGSGIDSGPPACLRILSLGRAGTWSGDQSTLQAWLQEKSNARVESLTARTPLTPAFLANYDVIILQEQSDETDFKFWTYEQAEIDAVAAWVRSGKGLITLSGYSNTGDEVAGTNQLLAFAGLAYDKASDTFSVCPDNMCYCRGNTVAFNGWTPGSWIATNMVAPKLTPAGVGVFHGRAITCADQPDAPCDIVGKDPVMGNAAVAKKIGPGRIFVWCDEWATYSKQWRTPTGQPAPGGECANATASSVFDIEQFWYNVLRWTAPTAACFTINDPAIKP